MEVASVSQKMDEPRPLGESQSTATKTTQLMKPKGKRNMQKLELVCSQPNLPTTFRIFTLFLIVTQYGTHSPHTHTHTHNKITNH